MDSFWEIPDFHFWELDKNKVLENLKEIPKEQQGLDSIFYQIYQLYASNLGKGNAKYLGDKSPINSYNLWWIYQLFPKAKFIHIHRDGRDVALSYVNAGLYDSIEQSAHRWVNSVMLIEKFAKAIKPENFIRISYTDLVLNTERSIKDICTFLGMDYQKSMIENYHSTFKDLGDTVSLKHHANVKRPINGDSIDKWKNKLSPIQVNKINQICSKGFEVLNYKVS